MKPMSCLLPALLVAFFFPMAIQAQISETGPASQPASPQVAPIGVRGVAAGSSDIYIRSSTGELIPLLLGDRIIEELLQRDQEQRSIPRYTIAQMEIIGAIDRDVVQLQLELQIQVNSENEWVTVPLAFGDVYITGPPTTSNLVEGGQSLLTSKDQNTREWHLKGKGLHTVKMELIGKARTNTPGITFLNLNLPAATASHAVFSFASSVELQKLPAGTVDKANRDERGVRSVEFWGLASGFSLSWSEVVARVAQKPVIQVQNRMKLDLTTIPVTLTGTQVLQISGSPVNEVRVTFPAGFQLVEADARNAAGVSVLNNFECPPNEGPVSALIRLTSALDGPLTLSFDLELTSRQFPQDIRVSVPSIQDANQQPGDLDILFPTGLLVQQTELKGAQRIRVTTESDLSVASTAFRMRSPESQIVLHVEETEAQFAVSPELILQPDSQNILMTARYPVNVLKGSLLDLSIIWPGYSGGAWQILPGTMRLTSGKDSLPLSMTISETEADVLQMTFPERQSGEFMVEFRAFMPLPAARPGAVQSVNFYCPEVESRRAQPFIIRTLESDEYSIQPKIIATGKLLSTVPVSAPSPEENTNRGLRSESWLHDDPSTPIQLDLPRQAPSVRAEIVIGMQPRENGIEVQESIRFEIEHRDMTSLFLQVPEGIRPSVRVAGQTEALKPSIESSKWSFRLPEARRGSLDVDVTYLWPAPLEVAQATNYVYQLPVILPQSADVLSVMAGTSSLSGLRVPDDAVWSPVYSERFESAMETTQSVAAVPLRWEDRLAFTSSASPDLIVVGTKILGGQIITSTVVVYDSVPEFVSIETPEDLRIEDLRLGERSLLTSDNDLALVQPPQRVTDRKMIRRTVAARRILGLQSGPVTLEVRTQEKLNNAAALWLAADFRRPVVVGESPAVPVVWCIGSQDEFQVVSATAGFASLTQRAATVFPGGDNARTLADRQLKAVLSPYTKEIQDSMMERADQWLNQPSRQDVFFGSADSGPLKLYVVPHVSLLLVSALTCVFFYMMMWLFRQNTIVVPVLFLACLGLVAWLIFPERTLMLAPYSGMGVVIGLVSVTFQRMTTDRRMRFPGTAAATEFPTVFGFSGIISPSLAESGDPAIVQAARPSEFSVSSAR